MGVSQSIFSFIFFITLLSCLNNNYPEKYIKNYSLKSIDGKNEYTYYESEHLDKQIPSLSLKPLKIYEYIDSQNNSYSSKIYFQNVFSILSLQDGYLINDDAGGRIIHTDVNFKLINIIGNKGIGPGEFSQPRYSIYDNGLLYSSGTSNRGFAVHDLNGKLITNFKPISQDYIPILTKFTVLNNHIFQSTPHSNNIITSIDTTGNIANSFGDKISGYSQPDKKVLNGGHLIKNDNNSFYFIGENAPIIQLYTKSGNLLASHNLIDHPYFESFFKGVQNRHQKSQRNDIEYLLTQDVQLYNKKLYLLTYAYDAEFNISLQKVLVVKFESDENIILEKEIVLSLPESSDHPAWFESLSISSSKIVAFESISGTFLEYNVEGL